MIPSGHGSKFELWLAASTKPPAAAECSRSPGAQPKQALSSGQLSPATRRYTGLGRGATTAVSQPVAKVRRHVGKEARDRREPREGEDHRGLPRSDYVVESSIGHIRDLPNRASEIPEKLKKESWARLGVDVEHGFEPLYVVDSDKKGKVSELKKLLKNADELLLATDEDREGEAIAWHLLEVLQPKVPVRRMVFHEITARRDPARARRDARGRPAPRRRPGDAADPRPPLRLRGLAGALEEGHAGPLGRPRPVGRRPARRRARARAPRLRLRRLLGHQRPVRSRLVRGPARRRRREARRAGSRLRAGRHAQVAPTWPAWTSPRRGSSQPGSKASPSPSAPPTRSRTRADPRRRS